MFKEKLVHIDDKLANFFNLLIVSSGFRQPRFTALCFLQSGLLDLIDVADGEGRKVNISQQGGGRFDGGLDVRMDVLKIKLILSI